MYKIPVTKPNIPNLSKLNSGINAIFNSGLLTNNGPINQNLERSVSKYLNHQSCSFWSSGTAALTAAILAVSERRGEVVTPSFTFSATSNSIILSGNKPGYIDISPMGLNGDPTQIRKACNENTVAILMVHCFGLPCDHSEISKISSELKIPLIYDAAHCFGADYKGISYMHYGDLAVTSTHATKVFNTIEGGFVFDNVGRYTKRLKQLRNFGLNSENVPSVNGLNGKNSELHALVGLLNLERLPELIAKRKVVHDVYRKEFRLLDEFFTLLELPNDIKYNYAYYPIFFRHVKDGNLERFISFLNLKGIQARRYFWPCLHSSPAFNVSAENIELPYSTSLSEKVLCLPIYPDLKIHEIDHVIETVFKFFNVQKS